jgi:predicted metal-dependent HD superfamily phosphohydrolase
MISPERLDQLQQSWARLLGGFGVSPAASYPIFDRLVAAYSEPHRHYHNLEHISEMLKVVGRLADLAQNLPAIQLAVWFHDAVYDPRAKDNEERSAALAVELLEPLGVPVPVLERITCMIDATRHASPVPADDDTAILLDADLAILGADAGRYARYAAAIRQEYAWVEEDAYCAGRTAVLRSFRDRSRIYTTQRMFEVGEEAARHNIATELQQLRESGAESRG